MARDINPTSVIGSPNVCCNADIVLNNTTPAPLLPPDHGMSADSVEEVLIQNDPASVSTVLVGDATRQTIRIIAGASMIIPCRLPTKLVVSIAVGSAVVHYLYRGQS